MKLDMILDLSDVYFFTGEDNEWVSSLWYSPFIIYYKGKFGRSTSVNLVVKKWRE